MILYPILCFSLNQHPTQEKQTENIVEKLIMRFKNADNDRQCRDIAFCLSLLPFSSEKSIKKLIDGMPHYQDKLYEHTVWKHFQEVLSKVRLGSWNFLCSMFTSHIDGTVIGQKGGKSGKQNEF